MRRELRAVDADRVVGAVADLGVGLVAGLDVGADAAVPQQVHGHLQDGVDDLGRSRRGSLDAEQGSRFR